MLPSVNLDSNIAAIADTGKTHSCIKIVLHNLIINVQNICIIMTSNNYTNHIVSKGRSFSIVIIT